MTIDISTPDGSSFSFPDGTTHDVIKGALDKHFGVAKPAPITAENVVRSVGRGIPVLGGLLDKANAATYAALTPAYESIMPGTAAGDTTISHKSSFGERYTENLARENVKDLSYAKEHPTANMVGELAGGIGSTVAAAPTAIGAQLLGLTGNTLRGAVWRGGLSGAGIGAADAITRGEDPIAAGSLGGTIGLAAPVVGRIASTIARPVTTAIRGIRDPAAEASRRVASAVQRDATAGTAGLTEPEFLAAQQAGHPVNLMDMGGETTRSVARSAANTSPEGRAILNRGIDDRFEGQGGRLAAWANTTFHYPNAQAQQAALEMTRRAGNNNAYRLAETASENRNPGGIWSPELERLTSSPDVVDAMRLAATRGKGRAVAEGYGGFNPGVTFDNGMLNFRRGPTGVPSYPDLRLWDYTYRNLRDAADKAFRTGANSEGGSLRAQANGLREAVEIHAPEWAQARAGAARHFGAEDALEAGGNYVTARLENRDARQAVSQFNQQERQLFQDGFVSRFIEEMRASPDRRSIVHQIINSPEKREKMAIALGPQRARELEALVHTEQIMDRARSAVQGNSTTARQLAELGLAGGVNWAEGGSPFSTDPQALMHAALVYGAARGHRVIDTRVARQVAELLASNDPQRLRVGMQLLTRNSNLFGALRNGDAALASIAARGSQPALSH